MISEPLVPRRHSDRFLAFGCAGVDIYPLEVGVGLEDVGSFRKGLGGAAANVAVAVARLGHSAAIMTGVGADPFGRYVRRALHDFGVSIDSVVTDPVEATPVTFCEVLAGQGFPQWLYRTASTPDLRIGPADIDFDVVRRADLLWISAIGLSEERSRQGHFAVLDARARKPITVLNLDYRPMLWDSPAHATEQVQQVLSHVTVAVGSREGCEVAVGESEPDRAADALLEAGVELAVIKLGLDGVLVKSRSGLRVESPPIAVPTLNGLGADEAFDGSLCHGLLAGWPLTRVLRHANAAAGIVASRLESASAMPTADEILTLLNGGNPNDRRADSLTAR
jgi:5-dehydro-2-deoxygluconokinase